jgi:hypothetical protein
VLAFGDLARRRDDGVRLLGVEEAEVLVDLRAGCLQQTHCTYLGALETSTADREVLDGALSLRAPQGIHGHPHLAHGVVFDPVLLLVALGHASNMPLPSASWGRSPCAFPVAAATGRRTGSGAA